MHVKNTIKVLCIGDVVGTPGKTIFAESIADLKAQYKPDFVMVNGENSDKGGRGLAEKDAEFLLDHGASIITTGNHVFSRKEVYEYLSRTQKVLRPLNYPTGCPGIGVSIIPVPEHPEILVAVVNLQGRVFMREHLACPFRALESVLTYIKNKTTLVLVDVHAEATSEKKALGYYFDGKISALVGTHTHIPTADEQILPQGTGYVTDLGMCGAYNSMLGMQTTPIIGTYLTQMPAKFAIEESRPYILSGVAMTLDVASGKCLAIERIKRCV